MKKLFAILLAVCLICALAVNVCATEEDGILYEYDPATAAEQWGHFTGNWTYDENGISVTNDGNDVWFYTYLGVDQGWTDYIIEVDLINVAEGGVIFRSTNPGPGVDSFGGYIIAYDSAYAYIGMDANDWAKYKDQGYSMDAYIGQAGFEEAFEEYLHGIDGQRLDVVSKDGAIIKQVYTKNPRAGAHVETTIDINLQIIAEDALADIIDWLKNPEDSKTDKNQEEVGRDVEGAAVVVMKVKTGEILACASYPTYNPQTYNEDLHIDALNHSISLIELAKDLRPEYSHSISGSVDLYHSFGRLQTNLLLEGFYTMLDDVFILEKTGESLGTDAEGNPITVINKVRRNAAGATVGGLTAELKLGIPNTFDVQLGYTFQKSQYVEPEQWSEDVEAQRTMFRSPDHYGYINAKYFFTKKFNASVFGTYTGPMLVQHSAYTDIFGVEHPDSETRTQSFWDFGFKLSYTFSLSNVVKLEVNAGMKNIFDSYQRDIDLGAGRDSAYIYGPAMPRTYFFGVKLYL